MLNMMTYMKRTTHSAAALNTASWLAGQKRSSRKSHGLTDNLQKKGPEVHKAGLRQQTYPEVGFVFATYIVAGGIKQPRAAASSVARKVSPDGTTIPQS